MDLFVVVGLLAITAWAIHAGFYSSRADVWKEAAEADRKALNATRRALDNADLYNARVRNDLVLARTAVCDKNKEIEALRHTLRRLKEAEQAYHEECGGIRVRAFVLGAGGK